MTLQKIDAWGRVILSEQGLLELFYKGNADSNELLGDDSSAIQRYNELCREFDSVDKQIQQPIDLQVSPEEFHNQRQNEWMIPKEFQDIDLESFLLAKCSSLEQRNRVLEELSLMNQYEMTPILNVMIYIVDILTKANVIWGVGRGSSVASYCLYLIGIHRIDSLKYGLDIKEFIKV